MKGEFVHQQVPDAPENFFGASKLLKDLNALEAMPDVRFQSGKTIRLVASI